MIASLSGTITLVGDGWAIVDVGGVGFRVYVPASILSALNTGEKVKLHTHLHLREDNVTLYGFSSLQELGLFETLIGVSGIGPKLGLVMLSVTDAEQLALAIAGGSTGLLTSIPGIGKKTAERIILELKDKISAGLVEAQVAGVTEESSEVLAALTALGFSVAEASRAVTSIAPSPNSTLDEKVRLALRYFDSRK